MRLTPRFLGVARNDKRDNAIPSGVGVPPDFHQADNLAQLWQKFLSLLELIAQIFCAVVGARANAVCGNRQTVFVSI